MENTKKCSKCGIEQPVANYCKSKIHKDGLRPSCNACKKRDAQAYKATAEGAVKVREAAKRSRDKSKDSFTEYRRTWRAARKAQGKPEYRRTSCAVYFKICPLTNQWFAAKTNRAVYSSEGYKIHRREVQKSEAYKAVKSKRRRISDSRLRREMPMHRLRENISRAINNSLRAGKGAAWQQVVGYTLHELKQHLESQFTAGMTWDNYGKGGWHIDHIKPVSAFFFTSVEDDEFKQCWSLSNLQPLWWQDNLTKGATYVTILAP